MKQIFIKTAIGVALTTSLFSCSNEIEELNTPSVSVCSTSSKEEVMAEFAKALSSVISENQDARELIKTEALKKFDKNYDILWDEIKDKSIGSCTLREAIAQKTSNEFIMQAETKVPLLNILFPEIRMFDVSPEKYSSSDAELPVVVVNNDKNLMFYAGKLTDEIKKGDVPAFNVLVVNENTRVEVDCTTRGSKRTWRFIDDAFDGTANDNVTRSAIVTSGYVSDKLKEAYTYFYKDDASNQSKALQRDYIYYGMTPQKTQGKYNYNVSEYINFIEVDPKAYFVMADQKEGSGRNDSMFREDGQTHMVVSKKKSDFTTTELINEIWTTGCYNFRFEIQKSTQSMFAVYVPVQPSDIWDFHEMEHREYRHSTMFRHSKYTYTIDINYFTPKRYYLPHPICLDRWDLREESLYRLITVYEEDDDSEYDYKTSYEVTKIKSNKFNGDVKMELGLGSTNNGTNVNGKVNNDYSIEVSNQNTTKTVKEETVKRKMGSDCLGTAKIYFYEPIIEGKITRNIGLFGINMNYYNVKTYTCGSLSFGLNVE